MSKTLLDFEYESDFQLIGLSCHQKDYRLAWFINKELGWELRKMNNLEVILKKGEKESFVRNTFHDKENHLQFDLISNLGSEFYLIPEHRKADYFIRIDGYYDNSELSDLISKLRQIEIVNLAFQIDAEALKSKNNLHFE